MTSPQKPVNRLSTNDVIYGLSPVDAFLNQNFWFKSDQKNFSVFEF